MRRRANWAVGVMLLAGAGTAVAQTGTTGTTAIPKSSKSFAHTGGAKTGAGGLNLTAPIPKAGGTTTGTGTTFGGFGGAKSGTGTVGGTTGTGGLGGGFGLGGNPGGAGLSTGQQVALLAQARLLVTGLESTGNLTLDRRESLLLTLLVYEALRQQAAQLGAGGAAPTIPMTITP